MNKLLAALLTAVFATAAQADVRITEWMYSGGSGEFIEFTNLGSSAVDFTGWSYDDESRLVGGFDLSALGLVGAGESVVITEIDAPTFRLDWSLAASVKVLGGFTNNIGRAVEQVQFAGGQVGLRRCHHRRPAYAGRKWTRRIGRSSGRQRCDAVGAVVSR